MTPEEFTAKLDRAGVTGDKRSRFLAEFERRHRNAFDTSVGKIAAQENAAQASSMFRGLAGTVGAAALNFVDSATLGHLPQVVGALSPNEGAGESIEKGLAASRITNPMAATVGSIGGIFSGPAGLTARGGAALARGVGTARAVQATRGAGFTVRAAAQVANNLVSGAGAITATELLRDREDNATITTRLADAAEIVSSPTNLALSGVVGLATAKFNILPSRELRPIIARYEKVTGQKVSPDVLSDNAEMQKFYDSALRIPGVANVANKVRRKTIAGFRDLIRDMGKGSTGFSDRDRAGRVATSGLQRIVNSRKQAERVALAQEGEAVLSREAQSRLLRGLASIRRGNRGGEKTTDFDPVIKELFQFVKSKRRISVFELENIRKQTASVAFTKAGMATRSRVEAAQFYDVIRNAMRSAAPNFSNAMDNAAKIRRIEERLPKGLPTDYQTMSTFWGGQKAIDRLKALEQNGTPEEIGAAKGWLFWELVRASMTKNGISSSAMESKFGGGGFLRKEIFDRALPGVREELLAAAKLSETFNKGILSAEGSQTAGRVARIVPVQTGIASFILGMMTNPYWTAVGTGLTAFGAATVTKLARSAIEGGVRNTLDTAIRTGPQGLSRLPVAVGRISGGENQ